MTKNYSVASSPNGLALGMSFVCEIKMLSRLITERHEHETEDCFSRNPKIGRDQKDDLKKGIDFLYSFKQALNELHPSVLPIIESMIKHDID